MFAAEKGLEYERLVSMEAADREYKECWRPQLTSFFALYLQQFGGADKALDFLCHSLVNAVQSGGGDEEGDKGVACVVVTDIRSPAELDWFGQQHHVRTAIRLRVVADDQARGRRGWRADSCKDEDTTETALDSFTGWDAVFDNSEDGDTKCRQWVATELLPRCLALLGW